MRHVAPSSFIADGALSTVETARQFINGGNATFTLRSRRTGTRFTYRVRRSEDGNIQFVSVLTGADNESSYSYLGYIRRDVYFHGGNKARLAVAAPSNVAFTWVWKKLVQGILPDELEIWHEGRCGRCNRKLTVPESISTGFGPECAGRI